VEWIRFFPAVVITGDKSNKSPKLRHYVFIVLSTIGTLRHSDHVLQKNSFVYSDKYTICVD